MTPESYQAPHIDFSEFQGYLDRMNSSSSEKAAGIFPYVITRPSRILSIGPGGGALELEMCQSFPEHTVLAVDYSLPMIEDLNQTLKGNSSERAIQCIVARANEMPLANNSIGTIVASSVIHEIATFGDNFEFGSTVDEFLLESWRVLENSGRLIIRDFMQYDQPEQMIELVVGKKHAGDPMDPVEFLKKFSHDFQGSNLSSLRQQLSYPITEGDRLWVSLADAIEIAAHFSWSRRYPDEIKERYAYFPIKKYVEYVLALYKKHGKRVRIVEQKTTIQDGYAKHINGRLNFYPHSLGQPAQPPIYTGYIVLEKCET